MSMRKPPAFVLFGASLALAACGGGTQESSTSTAPASTQAAAPAGGGGAGKGSASVSGKVTFGGAAPAAEKIKVAADPYCQEKHKGGLERQAVELKDGGVKDVLVYVKSGLTGTYPPPTDAAVLDQEGCTYHPVMLAVQANQPIKIRNSDETLHNIHPRPTANAEFNIGQPRKGMESTKTFDKKEVLIPVGCDVHPWMRSYISVLDHPFFAVTDDSGQFEIKDLPAGEYEIEAIHPRLKTQTGKITVKDGESAKLDLAYQG
jgi:hypothetical protein